MSFDRQGQSNIAAFLSAIAPWEDGYTNNSFTFLAIKQKDKFVLVQGAIWLAPTEVRAPLEQFSTDNVRAGHYRLSSLGRTYREIIDAVASSGLIRTPDGDLHFPPMHGSHHSASFTPLHPTALQSQSRVNVLRLGGQQQFITIEPSVLDWELRAARTPYDNLQELMNEYMLSGILSDVITLEIIGTAMMAIDGGTSSVTGEVATISINLAKSLDKDKVAVSYRLFSQGKVIARSSIEGNRFDWVEREEFNRGTHTLIVPLAAVLHCYSLYSGVAHTHWFVSDPSASQNSRRSIYESFDPGAGILNEFLTRKNTRGRDARDFEAGIAWLFWMLGFGVAYLGSTGRTQDFADIIVTTPSGHIAVIECTTGLLRADNKLPNLFQRATTVRRQLEQSNNGHLRLLPVIVTSLAREEVKADLEQAERLGALVLTRDEIDQLVLGTLTPGDADLIFENAERRVQEAQEMHKLRQSQNQIN